MIKTIFDPRRRYRVVLYLRMSSDAQNKRSPEQQRTEIELRLKALGLDWTVVIVYRDDAKSGRYIRKRRGYQKMLHDIKVGNIKVDLILVDTLERFGRVEELPAIRKELLEKCGVLVLTADSNFADPTTPQGKALGMFEAMRASEDGRIKAHNVFRGKRDAARLKHWPGGTAPFGYMLSSIMKDNNGCQEVDYRILVPNPQTDWIIKRLFNQAAETGYGQTRLARVLNLDTNIPAEYKPFQSSTVGYWLDNPIYIGDLLWAEHSTDIVDDSRVVQRNAEEDMIFVREFCQPLVPREVWDKVQAVRQARREQLAVSRKSAATTELKQIKALAPGLTLKYLLTGLIRCGHCRGAMTVSSSSYLTKAGEQKRYVAYICPGYLAGNCPNFRRVPEEWTRMLVMNTLRERLFPGS